MSEFQTFKKDLTKTRLVETDEDAVRNGLGNGQILVRVERFAFTANNVTYGAAGDTIGYWKFFPAANNESGDWGCLPVWGFAEVIESNVDGLEIGERLYGYYPPSDFLVMSPTKMSPQRFVDGALHRAELPAVYNNYQRISGETDYDSAMDNLRSLLFPLHVTSFCLCDALQEAEYHGASQIITVSASSKTAIGLAQGLAKEEGAPKIVGLTSRSNVDFVDSLGCYDQIICYDELSELDASMASVMVDMAGNRAVLGAVHGALGDNMLNCISVGMTHWGTLSDNDPLSVQMIRERTSFFFAPAHIQKRMADWGIEGYNARANAFMSARIQESLSWMQVEEIFGMEAFSGIYDQMVVGNINPNEGIVVVA